MEEQRKPPQPRSCARCPWQARGCERLRAVCVPGRSETSEGEAGKISAKKQTYQKPNSNQTVHDLFHESKRPAALLRAKLTVGGMLCGMQMLPASLLTSPRCIPLWQTRGIGLNPEIRCFSVLEGVSGAGTSNRGSAALFGAAACLCLPVLELLGGKMTYGSSR